MSFQTPTANAGSATESTGDPAADARLRQARMAVENLKTQRNEATERRKETARKKVELLKARLQMLKATASMNPKAAARLAAQLARELGAAAKAYASAGGSAGDLGLAPSPPALAAAPAAGGVPGDPAAGPVVSAAPTTDTGGQSGDTMSGEEEADQADQAAPSANPYQRAIDEANARAAEGKRKSGERQADGDFMRDVKGMAAELKQIIRRATDAADRDAELSPGEKQDMEAALATLDNAIQGGDAAVSGGGVSLLV